MTLAWFLFLLLQKFQLKKSISLALWPWWPTCLSIRLLRRCHFYDVSSRDEKAVLDGQPLRYSAFEILGGVGGLLGTPFYSGLELGSLHVVPPSVFPVCLLGRYQHADSTDLLWSQGGSVSQLSCWMVQSCRMALVLHGVLRRLRIWVKPTDIYFVCKTVFHSHFKLFLKLLLKLP